MGSAVYVCICNGVTEQDVRSALEAGCSSMTELTMRTGCGATCGCCVEVASSMVAEASAPAATALLPRVARAA